MKFSTLGDLKFKSLPTVIKADQGSLNCSKSVGAWSWSFTSSSAHTKKDNRSIPTHPTYSCLTA